MNASVAKAGAFRIAQIKVIGAERTSEETVLSRLELKQGTMYDAAKADRSLQALFATTQYKDVQISHAKGIVTIKVVEEVAPAAGAEGAVAPAAGAAATAGASEPEVIKKGKTDKEEEK